MPDTLVEVLKERLDEIKKDLSEVKADVKSIQNGYVSGQQLDIILKPMYEKIQKLEDRNLWMDRIIGGILIAALLGLVVTKGRIG